MKFQDPHFLYLMVLLIPLLVRLRRQPAMPSALPLSGGIHVDRLPETFRSRAARILPWMRIPVIALLIAALARPQMISRETKVLEKTVDLVVALDLSSSMLAEDQVMPGLRKNRLAVAKEVLADFLRRRSGDRVGLVAFAARPYPAAPLTLDHAWLKSAVERLQVGSVEDGTALGDALLAALNRLRDKPADSRAVILITDGRSNTGTPPDQAAAAAAALGIRVHTIGIGSTGPALFPVNDPLGGVVYRRIESGLDESALRSVAAATGGGYFRADDQSALERVFQEIDKLEKRPVERKIFFSSRELFHYSAAAALLLFMTSHLLGATLLRRTL